MVLDSNISKKICNYVYKEPRTIQDIAFYINKNWKTAERYVSKISQQQGTIQVKTFRGGTRGALKLVFWANSEKIHSTEFQEKLFRKIELGKKKQDFSPLDLYQYIDEDKREAYIDNKERTFGNHHTEMLKKSENQILCFSGNISWINYQNNEEKVSDIVEELMKKGIQFKIACRVDIASIKNINKILDIQNKLGLNCVEIRHCEQPLRGFVIDNEMASFKEIKNPDDYKPGELEGKKRIYYQLYDRDWIEWLNKVFYNIFRHSIDHKKRLNDLKSIKFS